jgi:hypothetical protein
MIVVILATASFNRDTKYFSRASLKILQEKVNFTQRHIPQAAPGNFVANHFVAGYFVTSQFIAGHFVAGRFVAFISS